MALLSTIRNNRMLKALIGLVLTIPAVAGVLWDEVLLATPIIALVNFLGFWLGYVVFCFAWAAVGIFILSVWLRIEPWVQRNVLSKIFGPKSDKVVDGKTITPTNWRERTVLWFAGIAQVLGAFAAAVVLGPVFGWPIFKLLGYRERDVYALTIAAAWVFGAIWVPFYSLGVWGLGLSHLF